MWVVELQFDGGARKERIWLKAGELYMGRRPSSYVFSESFSQQISRKQAVFIVTYVRSDQTPTLEMKNISSSCPMRKNTNDYIPSGDTVTLVEGDCVEFGRKESSLNIKLVFHYETMVWCTTGLSSKERSQARAVGQSLGIPIVAEWQDQVTHMITRQTPAPSAKLFFALLNGSVVVNFAWIARLAGLLTLQRIGGDSAAILLEAKSYQPSLKRLESTILRAASASQAQVQEITASQAVVPAVDQVELDFTPQKSRSELFKSATIIFAEPDKVHEQFVRMGGGNVLHVSPSLSLSEAIASSTTRETNALAIFQHTSSKKVVPKFEIDPSYVFITDVDIVNAILTNVKPEIQWTVRKEPPAPRATARDSSRKRKRSMPAQKVELDDNEVEVIAKPPKKVEMAISERTTAKSSEPRELTNKATYEGGASSDVTKTQVQSPQREMPESSMKQGSQRKESPQTKPNQPTNRSEKQCSSLNQSAGKTTSNDCSTTPKTGGSSHAATVEPRIKQVGHSPYKRENLASGWKVADRKQTVSSELVIVRNLMCPRTQPIKPKGDKVKRAKTTSKDQKDFKGFRKNAVIVRSHQQPVYKFQAVKVRETDRLRQLREMEEQKEQEYQRMQAFFRKSANESKPKAKRGRRKR